MNFVEDVGSIIREVAMRHKVSARQIFGTNRSKGIIYARMEAIWRIYEELSVSKSDLGRMFKKDHSTIWHSVNRVEDHLAKFGEWPVHNIGRENFSVGSFNLRIPKNIQKQQTEAMIKTVEVVVPKPIESALPLFPKKKIEATPATPKPPKKRIPKIILPCAATRQADRINRYWARHGVSANARAEREGQRIVVRSDLELVKA